MISQLMDCTLLSLMQQNNGKSSHSIESLEQFLASESTAEKFRLERWQFVWVHSSWLCHSLFLTCNFEPIVLMGWKRGEERAEKKRGHMKSKRGNLGLQRNRVTVSPSLWVWRSEEERRNMVMVFSQNTDMGNCCRWQNWDTNLTRLC